ncbi:MAG TPA: FkbM family methyltransferase [Edaphobacter sp.]|nr:FkbM family methyltransferase [Edaphobacter sp.]
MTPLVQWARGKARLAVDSVFCSSSPDIRRLGDEHSGWVVHLTSPPSVAYCAGVGQGMSFELALAKIMPRPVLVFDPSPTGVATVAASDTRNMQFFPIGLAAHTGILQFSVPKDPGEGSYSVVQHGIDVVSFDCLDLPAIMSSNGDTSIDLLKMDIEGFEYDIIDQLLDERIPVRQICVEFHDWLRPGQTRKTIVKLYRAGYRIIHKKRGDHTFLFKESRFDQLRQGSRPSEKAAEPQPQ